MLSIFDLVAILLTVSAVFAFVNAKLLRLPTTIGVMIMGLAASLILAISALVRTLLRRKPDVQEENLQP